MFQTVLLNAQETEGARTHLLSSVRPETEDIPVPYYPFIIGKNRDLADYVLDRETVSRFHLRIDREGERVFVTDLNSTNGTQVGGRLLAANETAELYPGDEVVIADMAYIWRGEPAS